MKELFSSGIFLLSLTIGMYLAGVFLYRKTKLKLLHPLLTSTAAIIIFLNAAGVEYEVYREATAVIDLMLGLSVVALGYLLYENMVHVKGRFASIMTAVAVGGVVGILSVVFIAKWMGAGEEIVRSIQPKSVTTPIALSISEKSGGIEALTSLVVVYVGIFGSIAGPFVLKRLGIENKIAKGLALGSASHAMGTAEAIKLGTVEGAISGLAIGLMGVVTALLVPLIEMFV